MITVKFKIHCKNNMLFNKILQIKSKLLTMVVMKKLKNIKMLKQMIMLF